MNIKPRLTTEILRDKSLLADAIDAVTRTDRRFELLTKEVLRFQADLRHIVNDKQWSSYLTLDEAVNDRSAHLTLLLVRWAFNEGLRQRAR